MKFELRELQVGDVPRIAATDGGAAWHGGVEKWDQRLADQINGQRLVLVAVDASSIFGYGSLLWASGYPSFREAGIPEINDVVVDEAHRGQGVATRLIRALEDQARAAGCTKIGIGVGLYRDYGSAQRLYIRLGYVPDGNGIAYAGSPVTPGEKVLVDDDLSLWLVKPL